MRPHVSFIMHEEIEAQLQGLVAQNKLEEAIAVVEQQILQNPIADFTQMVGKSLLHLTNDLVDYLDQFCAAAGQEIEVQSLFAEMNGFTVNYDFWYVELFAFNRNEGTDDTDWLADYDYPNSRHPAAAELPITGLEDIQAIYQHYMDTGKWEDDAHEGAANDCAALIVLRVQQLFKAAKEVATARKLKWAVIPIYVTAHDSYIELLYQA